MNLLRGTISSPTKSSRMLYGDEHKTLSFQRAPYGIVIIKSRTGIIVHANDSYCDMIGYGRDQIIGSAWMTFTHPDDLERDKEIIRKMYETHAPQMDALRRYIRPDGTIVPAKVTITPFNDSIAEPTHMVMVQDLTGTARIRDELKTRTKELRVTREAVLSSLVVVSRFRDRETGEHLERTREYMRILLEAMSDRHSFSIHGIEMISNASMLHDIGKIGIPDAILLKEGILDADEKRIMETHTILGANAIRETMRKLRGDSSLMYAREIAEFHHERWDGTGYPRKLSENYIPLSARVMAVADVYDALRSDRPYKKAIEHGESVRIIRESSGRHFDPDIVKVFLHHEKTFNEISVTQKEVKQKYQEQEFW
jgi:PAS domain S-box-containing protein